MRRGLRTSRRPAAAGGLDVVLATIASDSHTWNLIFLELLLREWGHRVVNLGPCVPDALLRGECQARRPDLVVISTVNGHGADEGARLARTLRAAPGLGTVPLVIGGKLGTGQEDPLVSARNLVDAGFSAVFGHDNGGMARFRRFVDRVGAGARC
ncbi:cobalamin-dependent protein [Amycolatopsis sp. OK19-0408]|uniref:Cobalamin-dependent protein n=1 Tax=Amycolatopsis iheyensis TaxID=2945988 RepID=A0A9X2NEG5_9PSEU|nr:cobalamin-dependent protein [Amycolatopsis iheyensis]MCR6485766.1 cobalamin-dependent protein [Amycolatopsis iheyensis]